MNENDTTEDVSCSPTDTPSSSRDSSLWQPTKTWLGIVGVGTALVWFFGLIALAAKEDPLLFPVTTADKASVLLMHPSFLLWAPVVLAAAVAMVTFIENPRELRRSFGWRMGIYSGAIVATYHWGLLGVWFVGGEYAFLFVLMTFGAVPSGALLWGIMGFVNALQNQGPIKMSSTARALIGLLLVPVILVLFFTAFMPLLLGGVIFIFCAPTLALIAYGGVSVYLLYHGWKDAKGQYSLKRIFLVTAWLAGLLSLWRVTVVWALGA